MKKREEKEKVKEDEEMKIENFADEEEKKGEEDVEMKKVEADVFTGEKFSELPISDKLKEVLAMHDFTTLTSI